MVVMMMFTHMFLVCTSMLFVCTRIYSYVTRMYSCVVLVTITLSIKHLRTTIQSLELQRLFIKIDNLILRKKTCTYS